MSKTKKDYLAYVKVFKFKSIFINNLVRALILVMLPFTIFILVFCMNAQKHTNDTFTIQNKSVLNNAQNTVDRIINESKRIALQMSMEEKITSLLFSVYDEEFEGQSISEKKQEVKDYICKYKNGYSYIYSISVYVPSRNIIISDQKDFKSDEHPDADWISVYEEMDSNQTKIFGRKWGGEYPDFISIMCTIGYIDGTKGGCVMVDINVEELNDILNELKGGEGNEIFLMDKNDTIYLSPHQNWFLDELKKHVKFSADRIIRNNDNYIDVAMRDETYKYMSVPSDKYDMYYAVFVPDASFKVIMKQSITFFTLFAVFMLIIVILVTAKISLNSYIPIKKMIDLLGDFPEGDISAIKKTSEMEYIYSKISENLHSNKALAEELNYRIMLLQQSQARALQAQINPHFLNNVLERINWTAVNCIGETNPISDSIHSLSILFESILDSENYLVTIAEEFHHGNVYAYIVGNTYDDECNLVWDINGEIMDYYIPKLTLQPIIENAFIYGISEKEDEGKITIKGDFYEDGIRFVITDDGMGIEEEKLKALQESLNGDKVFARKHIGMRNVNQRIKLLFGEQYGLSINSQYGEGTEVSIYIPRITEKDAHKEI